MSHGAAARIERIQDIDLPDEGFFLGLLDVSEPQTEEPDVVPGGEPAAMVQMEHAVKDFGSGRGKEVVAHLKPEGIQLFVREIVAAVYVSQQTGDLRPLQDVIEAWYRSLRFIRDPGFLKAAAAQEARAESGDHRIFELEEIGDRLGLSD